MSISSGSKSRDKVVIVEEVTLQGVFVLWTKFPSAIDVERKPVMSIH